jgi:hypothetical protein
VPATTAKGYPYPVAGDNNNVPADIQALATYVDARPGVSPLTTAQRDALAGVDLWNGRVIWNTTTGQLERYNGATWGAAAPGATFGAVGDIAASAVADTAAAGASGKVADASHRHAREGFGTVSASTSFGQAAANGTAVTEARSDHVHGTPAAPTPASIGALALTGGTVTGLVRHQAAGSGSLEITAGDATHSPHLDFFSTSVTARQGYIGNTTTAAGQDAGTIPYVAGTHAFTGAITSTGTITENGARVYSANNPPPASGAVINATGRGTVAGNGGGSVTITAVVMAKTQVRHLGANGQIGSGTSQFWNTPGTLQLTSTTNLTFTQSYTGGATDTWAYEYTEWT